MTHREERGTGCVVKFMDTDVPVGAFWAEFVAKPGIQRELDFIGGVLKEQASFTPEHPTEILRFLAMDRVECVILGQDPYDEEGDATGRAFEVKGLTNWTNPATVNTSLQKILLLLARSHPTRAPAFSTTGFYKAKHKFSEFILPPNQLFDHWQREGVLLLNTALTCELDEPASHSALWSGFINSAIRYVCTHNPEAYWFLWGKHASRYKLVITAPAKRTFQTCHPAARKNNTFLTCTCFSKTRKVIDWYGLPDVMDEEG